MEIYVSIEYTDVISGEELSKKYINMLIEI